MCPMGQAEEGCRPDKLWGFIPRATRSLSQVNGGGHDQVFVLKISLVAWRVAWEWGCVEGNGDSS